jgi:hypothetical protein
MFMRPSRLNGLLLEWNETMNRAREFKIPDWDST